MRARAVAQGIAVTLALVAAAPAFGGGAPNSMVIQNDPEIDLGKSYFIDPTTNLYSEMKDGGVELRFDDPQSAGSWSFSFYPPLGARLKPGFYSGTLSPTGRDARHPSMSWTGDGTGGGAGTFEVKDLERGADGSLSRLWVVFVPQVSSGPGSFGELRINMPPPEGSLYAIPTRVRWPSADVERPATPADVRIAATAASVSVERAEVRGADAGSFSLISDGCTGTTVSSGGYCDVKVAYRPTRPGTHAAALHVVDGSGADLAVPLEGYSFGGRTKFVFDSDPGDFIGQGKHYEYTQADGVLEAFAGPRGGGFSVLGPHDTWFGAFQPVPGGRIRRGVTYTGAKRYDRSDQREGNSPGLEVIGQGRGCNQLTGEFTVHDWKFDADGGTTEMSFSFVQHCEDSEPAFRGQADFRVGNRVPPPPWGLPYRVARPSFVRHSGCGGLRFRRGLVKRGTRKGETMRGGRRGELFLARGGADRVYAGGGKDCVVSGPGRDFVDCGRGRDHAVLGRHDRARRCEVLDRS